MTNIETPCHAVHDADTAPLDAQWARLGGGFTVAPARDPVDLERLIVTSARAAPCDARLFWVMASWIAVHHKLIDVRRLGRLLDAIQDDPGSAVAGAALDVALTLAGNVKSLKALRRHCRPMAHPRPLFEIVRENRVLSMVAKRECRPEFAAWGLWQHEISDKRDAVHPVHWILARCPEFRLRSLLGADLETAIIEIVSDTPSTISDLAKRTGATRAAVHEAVANLTARGLTRKPREGYRKLVSVPPELTEWLRQFPTKRRAA